MPSISTDLYHNDFHESQSVTLLVSNSSQIMFLMVNINNTQLCFNLFTVSLF